MERLSDDVPDSRNMSTDDFASIALIEKEENFDPEELSPGCLSSFLQKERFHRTPPALLLSYVLFFLSVLIWISTVIQYRSIQESSQRASCSIWNPYTEVTGKDWHKVQRNNSGIPNNPWKGEPSPEIDEAWKKIWMIGAESYTYEEIERVGKDPRGVARWPQEFGGGYAAKTEIFHQLHCLNIIRKGLSPEYYGETTRARAHICKCRTGNSPCISMGLAHYEAIGLEASLT